MRIFLLLSMLFSAGAALCAEEKRDERKTLLVLSSIGGGGHAAACAALNQLVGKEYNIQVIYPINELKMWGVPGSERIYNKILKKGWIRSMNFLVRHVSTPMLRARHEQTEQIIASFIEAHKPSLVISLIPFINYPASEAARKNDVPFLVITTDNDLRNWVVDLERVTHQSMKITIGTDQPLTKDLILEKQIPLSAIELTGLPLREEFLSHKEKRALCEEWGLDLEQKRVLIMMGGAGGVAAYDYAEKIGKMPLGVHLIVIAGRNEALKEDLLELSVDPSNQLTVFGFTNRVADLMAISDVIVTKPGPGTINEAVAMRLPILIDNTDISLFWERSTVDLILKQGLGQKIRKFHELEGYLNGYLYNEEIKKEIEHAFLQAPVNQFHLKLPSLIHEMIHIKDRPHAELVSNRSELKAGS